MISNVTEYLKQDVAATIRDAGFPKFDATLYSKVNNPECGIQLCREAKIAENRFFVENGLKMPCKVGMHPERPEYPRCTVRMPVAQLHDLQEQMAKQGIYTLNLMINKAIETALDVWERNGYAN